MIDSIVDKYITESPKIDKKRTEWMAEYEKYLSHRDDHKPGKVDWESAEYLYRKGMTSNGAAKLMKNPYLR